MEAEFWHERWRNNQIGFHQEHVNPWLEKYWSSLDLDENANVLVPLCGKSRDMLWLLSRGFRVTGVEISEIAVEAFFRESDLAPRVTVRDGHKTWECGSLKIISGDFFAVDQHALGPVTGLYDRASLIAFPPSMRQRYVSHLSSLVAPGTRGLLVTLEYPAGQMDGPPFAVNEAEVYQLFNGRWEIGLLERNDCLEDNEKFRERGLTALAELVYHLKLDISSVPDTER